MILARRYRVTLFERSRDIFAGATYANHNRHHLGFHYPRSLETARQCINSRDDFVSLYGDAECWNFANYYCVGAEGSRVTPDQYLAFCREAGLEFREEWPPEGAIAREKIALSLRVREGVCDFYKLKSLAEAHLRDAASRCDLRLGHEVRSGRVLPSGSKELEIFDGQERRHEEFDFVVNSTYASYNLFCEWFGFAKRPFQFNLQELNLIKLPGELRLGLTVMDGEFPSFLPFGNTGLHILAHVTASQLVRESSLNTVPLLNRLLNVESNWAGVLGISSPIFPVLKQAQYQRSLFVDRVVDATNASTDARLTELTAHGQGCYSIFAAKVITCVSTAKKLAGMLGASA